MKNKVVLYGVGAALVVLLYFKFGKKSLKVNRKGSGGSGGRSGGGGFLGKILGGGGDAVQTSDGNSCPNSFFNYYGQMQHTFNWNNGQPTVTKQMVAMPMSANLNFSNASGGMIDRFSPVTSRISVDEFEKACDDYKSGNFSTSPATGGGINPKGGGGDKIIKPIYPIKEVALDVMPIGSGGGGNGSGGSGGYGGGVRNLGQIIDGQIEDGDGDFMLQLMQ